MSPAIDNSVTRNTNNQSQWKSQNNVEDWVCSFPYDNGCSSNGQTRRNSLDSNYTVTRKKGTTGLNHGIAPSAADVYHLAISARRARERQSRISVDQNPPFGNGAKKNGEVKNEERAGMLRAAFAAQRLEQGNSFQSETSTYSFDSGMEFVCEEDEEDGPEEILLDLGFGGPPQGAERVPDRFLRPSQLPGIDFEKYILAHKDLEQTYEPITWGGRELSGLSTRRPSTMSIIMDRFRENPKEEAKRKASVSYKNERSIDLLCVAEEETHNEEETPHLGNVFESSPIIQELAAPSSRKSSFSSRKSSLRRQECVDEEYPNDDLPPSCRTDDNSTGISDISDIVEPQSLEEQEDLSGPLPLPLPLPLPVQPFLPTVYVTPPPSTVFEMGSIGDMEEPASSTDRSNTPEEFGDPVFSVLQLALEAYRARLDTSPTLSGSSGTSPLGSNPCDWNHNSVKEEAGELSSIRQDIRDELARTQQLLKGLHQRLASVDRPYDQTHEFAALRNVLVDMTSLLQEQRRMQRQSMELELPVVAATESRPHAVTTDPVEEESSPKPVKSGLKAECGCSQSKTSWLRGMERRLTVQIRRAVRMEIRKALSQTRGHKNCSFSS